MECVCEWVTTVAGEFENGSRVCIFFFTLLRLIRLKSWNIIIFVVVNVGFEREIKGDVWFD